MIFVSIILWANVEYIKEHVGETGSGSDYGQNAESNPLTVSLDNEAANKTANNSDPWKCF